MTMPQPKVTPTTDRNAAAVQAQAPITDTPVADADALAKSLAAAHARIAELEAAGASIDDPETDETGKYMVLSAGVSHRVGGRLTHITLALAGQVIDLVDDEARRLLMLGAVRAADEADIAAGEARALRDSQAAAAQLVGPADNPYGGQVVGGRDPQVTLALHAEEQIARARKSGAL